MGAFLHSCFSSFFGRRRSQGAGPIFPLYSYMERSKERRLAFPLSLLSKGGASFSFSVSLNVSFNGLHGQFERSNS